MLFNNNYEDWGMRNARRMAQLLDVPGGDGQPELALDLRSRLTPQGAIPLTPRRRLSPRGAVACHGDGPREANGREQPIRV